MTKVARVERMEAKQLRSNRNIALLDDLVDIVQEHITGPDRETIANNVLFRQPTTRLLLYRDREGELLGFSVNVIERHEIEGRVYGVMNNGTYIKHGVRGVGPRAVAHTMADTLAFKLRNPTATLCFVGEVTSPAVYRLCHRFGPGIHPRPNVPIPESVTAVVREVMTKRGFHFVDGDPWRVHIGFPVLFKDEERMRRFIDRSDDDPSVAFFLKRNPGFFEGHWLVVYARLGLGDLLRAYGPILRNMLLPTSPAQPT